jgi:hypothetical protein
MLWWNRRTARGRTRLRPAGAAVGEDDDAPHTGITGALPRWSGLDDGHTNRENPGALGGSSSAAQGTTRGAQEMCAVRETGIMIGVGPHGVNEKILSRILFAVYMPIWKQQELRSLHATNGQEGGRERTVFMWVTHEHCSLQSPTCDISCYESASSSALASCRSAVSKPSVNQP